MFILWNKYSFCKFLIIQKNLWLIFFFYNIFVITVTFLMLIIGQKPVTPLQKCFQEKEVFLCNDLLKNNLQKHSVANNWELPVLFFRF